MRAVAQQVEGLRSLKKKRIAYILIGAILSSVFCSPNSARAVSLGESVLTVAATTGVGAVLGASTLPFYPVPGDHLGNIYYGAAIGAVIGVFLAATVGLKEGPEDESYIKNPQNKVNSDRLLLAKSTRPETEFRPRIELVESRAAMLWAPVAKFKF